MAIERSADGIKFEELGRVKGAGTTHEPQEYTFIDDDARRGLNYYRLRQVDYDGTFEYRKVISVLFGGKETGLGIRAFPNPVHDQLRVSWAAVPAPRSADDVAGVGHDGLAAGNLSGSSRGEYL